MAAKHETAPRAGSWVEHLSAVSDEELTTLSADYCWILEKNRPEEERETFRQRREAILAECQKRGLTEAANSCRPSQGADLGE